MENFTFRNATKIIFGKDTENQVGIETARYGGKVLLHYGGESGIRSFVSLCSLQRRRLPRL
ncbi:unnamed protein product [marine sediment metagenome]|uniref:Alcohol dehydrogenase iron-type/glycerol dehydrogenase GldA domain-containing protein n=1 Tax=marine sediment metagenome TaxID=412755 RepID=X1L1Z8_9ZZZZ